MAEKGIRTVWIDSDSVGVLGTKVYRDDVLIATVPFGTLKYDDPTAVVGVNYKYEVQAYTVDSESTDETLDVNMAYYQIQGVELMPIMTNFRIENDNRFRVYFDTPLGPVTGIDPTKFYIEGKQIDSVNTDENYFELTTNTPYWENALTIRQEGGNGIVYDFTMQYISNYLDEVTTTNEKFVAVGASGTGASEGDPMSITDAFSESAIDTTYWIKKGDYGAVNCTVTGSGSTTQPIKFMGYDTTPGDNPSIPFARDITFDANVMPLITGSVTSSNQDFIIFRSLQVDNANPFTGDKSNNNAWVGCYAKGGAVNFDASNQFTDGVRNTWINCWSQNASNANFRIAGVHCAILGCYSATEGNSGTDYAFSIYGHEQTTGNHVIKGCTINADYLDEHSGHGYSLKPDDGRPLEYCLIENSTCYDNKSPIQFRHNECRYCVARNVTAEWSGNEAIPSTWEGVRINGGEYNTVENCTFINLEYPIYFLASTEAESATSMGKGNKFINCIMDNESGGGISMIYMRDTYTSGKVPEDNEVINTSFIGRSDGALFSTSTLLALPTGNTMSNSIIQGVPNLYSSGTVDSGFSFANNDFSGCGTWADSYIGSDGNFEVDPNLNASYQPQADFNSISVPKIATINYDKDGNERQDPTTVGAVLSAEETPNAIPVYSVSTSELGMIENNESEALNNANKLIGGLNSTVDGINVDGVYFIQTPGTGLTATDIRLASTNSGELKSNQSLSTLFTSYNIKNIECYGVTFSDVFSGGGDLRLFYDNAVNEDIIGDLVFNSNIFNGSIFIYWKRTTDTFNPADYGIDEFTFSYNNINNNRNQPIYIRNLPIAVCNIVGNTIRNCDNTIVEFGIGNGSTYENEMSYARPLITVTDNDMRNDVDFECIGSVTTYQSFCVIEANQIDYLRNHVEGIWCTTDLAVYDAYLSCNIVNYKNNVNKNNIEFFDDNYTNTLIKCKSHASDYVNPLRNYENNQFIVEESWIDQVVLEGANKDYAFVNFAETPSGTTYIKNNTFNIYSFIGRINNQSIPIHYEISGNTYSLTYSNNIYTETLEMTDSDVPGDIVFSDNVFNVLNISTEESLPAMVRVVDLRTTNTDKINSITFNNNTGTIKNRSVFAKHDTELLEINNNDLLLNNDPNDSPYFAWQSYNKISNSGNNNFNYANDFYYLGLNEYSAEQTLNDNITFDGVHGNGFGRTMELSKGMVSSPTKTIRRTYTVDDGDEIFYFEFTLSYDTDHWNVTFINSSDVEVTYRLNNNDGQVDGEGTVVKLVNSGTSNTTKTIQFSNKDGNDNTGFYQNLGSNSMKLNIITQNT